METTFFLLLVSTMWNLVLSSTNCHCSKSTCVTPVNCTHGLVWDHCYCCRICAKREGEVCGGKNYMFGECGKWQECIVRNRRNYLNRFKKHDEMIGRCEPCEFYLISFLALVSKLSGICVFHSLRVDPLFKRRKGLRNYE